MHYHAVTTSSLSQEIVAVFDGFSYSDAAKPPGSTPCSLFVHAEQTPYG